MAFILAKYDLEIKNFLKDSSLKNMAQDHGFYYPTPNNINFMWTFGFLAMFCLISQILTGILLTMHYTPEINYAWLSVEHIMRDVKWGWLIRYLHANGASFFFIAVYLHIGRGIYFQSYFNASLWFSGTIIFILMMASAFLGYVLPWGQMSFWGATVITNLFTAVPLIGEDIALWLWGGFSINNATLNRFFALHYLLPLVIVGLTAVHIGLLHLEGSSNPLGVDTTKINRINFYPYFILKDVFGLFVFLDLFALFVFYFPDSLGHPDNYIIANALVTPSHIVPEWYFLPYYAILRSIPDKLGGVACMGLALVVVLILPLLHRSIKRSLHNDWLFIIPFWFLVIDVCLLGWLGACPVQEPYVTISQIGTVYYFFFFLVWMPFLKRI